MFLIRGPVPASMVCGFERFREILSVLLVLPVLLVLLVPLVLKASDWY